MKQNKNTWSKEQTNLIRNIQKAQKRNKDKGKFSLFVIYVSSI